MDLSNLIFQKIYLDLKQVTNIWIAQADVGDVKILILICG